MCLLTQNIKPNIFGNGNKCISNIVIGELCTPLMGTPQKVYFHRVYRLTIRQIGRGHKLSDGGKPKLVCHSQEKTR